MKRPLLDLVMILAASAALANPAVHRLSVAPWQPIATGYDSTMRHGRIIGLPTPPPNDPSFFQLVENAVLTMTADNGGLSRSVEIPLPSTQLPATPLGKRWENVNGGRGFTSSHCGGYNTGAGCTDVPGLSLVLGGPPSGADQGGSFAPVASGRAEAGGGWPESTDVGELRSQVPGLCLAPDGSNRCAGGILYRTDVDMATGNGGTTLFASPDAGLQWYPLSPGCAINSFNSIDHVAVDPGRPGHVVVTAAKDGGPTDAGGCDVAQPCQARPVAWTKNVDPQLSASFLATTPTGGNFAFVTLDLAGGIFGSDWRYAALSHLATNRLVYNESNGWTESQCNVLPPDPLDLTSQPPAGVDPSLSDQCKALLGTEGTCHGIKGTSDDQHLGFCPSKAANAGCNCTDPAPATCKLPAINALSIDPRNGHVYASSNAGVLISLDGGKSWHRRGNQIYWRYTATDPSGTFASTGELHAGTGPFDAGIVGVRLLTMQGLDNVFPRLDQTALDLNAQPAWIETVSPISMVFEACTNSPNPAEYDVPFDAGLLDSNGNQLHRKRGRVTATVAVTWRNPIRPAQELSGVFVASASTCDPADDAHVSDPLVFRDTSSLVQSSHVGSAANWVLYNPSALENGQGTAEWLLDGQHNLVAGTITPNMKLPRLELPQGTLMHYTAAAVAPSDSRIIYAWGYPIDGGQMLGLWRSTNRGATWHLAVSSHDPQTRAWANGWTKIGSSGVSELSVSPLNPSRVLAASSVDAGSAGDVIAFEPASEVYAAGEHPKVDCGPCSNCQEDGNPLCQPPDNFAACRRDKVLPDICQLDEANGPLSIWTWEDGNGAFVLPTSLTTPYSQCEVVPVWEQPAPGAMGYAQPHNATTTCVACDSLGVPLQSSPQGPCCLLARQMVVSPMSTDLACQNATSSPTSTYWGNTNFAGSGASGGSVRALASVGGHVVVGAEDQGAEIAAANTPPVGSVSALNSAFLWPFAEGSKFKFHGWTPPPPPPPPEPVPVDYPPPCNWSERGIFALLADPSGMAAWGISGSSDGKDYAHLVRIAIPKKIAGDGTNEINKTKPDVAITIVDPSQHDETKDVVVKTKTGSNCDPNNPLAGAHRFKTDYRFSDGVPFRLKQGPNFVNADGKNYLGASSLIASIPDVGVFITGGPGGKTSASDVFTTEILDKMTSDTDKDMVSNSNHRAAVAIPFDVGTPMSPSKVAFGVCVRDVERVGEFVYAAVHAAAIPPTDCGTPILAKCNDLSGGAGKGPGLYRAKLTALTLSTGDPTDFGIDVGSTPPVFTFVGKPDTALHKLTALRYDAPSDLLLVAESAALGDTGPAPGGVWALTQPAAADVGAGATWHLLAATGNVSEIVVGQGGVAFLLSSGGAAAAEHTANAGNAGFNPRGGGDVSPWSTVIQALNSFGELGPGLYALKLPTAPGQPFGAPAACADTIGPSLPTTSKCALISGVRAGGATIGAANAGSQWFAMDLSVEDPIPTLLCGFVGGDGAYQLPPPQGLASIPAFDGWVKTASVSSFGGTFPEHQWDAPFTDNPWTTRFATGWYRGVNDTPLGAVEDIPAWIHNQLDLNQPGHLWQRVDIAADHYREGVFNVGTPGPNFAVSFAHDEPGPEIQAPVLRGDGTTTFNVEANDPSALIPLARLRLTMVDADVASGEGRVLLNGEPLDWTIRGGVQTLSKTILTGAIRAGENVLSLRCEAGVDPCQVHWTTVKVARGIFGQMSDTASATDPKDRVTEWYTHIGAVSRRHAIWAAIGLQDPNVPTWIRWNGGRWRPVQSGAVGATDLLGHPYAWRVLVEGNYLHAASNSLEVSYGACLDGNCPDHGNLGGGGMVIEYSEDEQVCAPSPETCNDHTDNDCDGATDESGNTSCDAAGGDGCALGTLSCCDPLDLACTPTCTDDVDVAPLPRLLTQLNLPVQNVALVLPDGGVVNLDHLEQTLDLVGILRDGVFLRAVEIPGNGDSLTVAAIKISLASSAIGRFTGLTGDFPISLRMDPNDNGRTFTFRFPSNTTLYRGEHLILAPAISNLSALEAVYGCPGGELTYPSHIDVVNVCRASGIDCRDDSNTTSLCDTAPPSPVCLTCTGDWNGCSDGVMYAASPGMQEMCYGDTESLQDPEITVANVTVMASEIRFHFSDSAQDTICPLDNQVFNLSTLTTSLEIAFPTCWLPANPDPNLALVGIEIHGAASIWPIGNGEPHPAYLRSGPGEPRDVLWLKLANPVNVNAGGAIALHLTAENAPPWNHAWWCETGEITVRNWLVVERVTPGGPPPPPPPPPSPPCAQSMLPSAMSAALTGITFCFDDGSCLTQHPPQTVTIDLLDALNGIQVFGGLPVPTSPLGGDPCLTSARLLGDFSAVAFTSTLDAVQPVLNPTVASSPEYNPVADGLQLTFALNLPGTTCLKAGSTFAFQANQQDTTYIYQCPDSHTQSRATVGVHPY